VRYNSDSLGAFWPGVLAQMGELRDAARTLNAFYAVWREHRMMPEQFDFRRWIVIGSSSPLRPELIEATLHLWRATGDDSWRWAALDVLHSLERWTRSKCGFASIKNVVTKEQEDIMPSYFLSETLKYFLLLFGDDQKHAVENTKTVENGFVERDYVYTTEAHPLPLLAWGQHGSGVAVRRREGEAAAVDRMRQQHEVKSRSESGSESGCGSGSGSGSAVRFLARRQCRKVHWWEGSALAADATFVPRFVQK